jgi:hypothetical protein
MARDGLFRASGQLNDAMPAWGLVFQGLWAVFLVLPRTAIRHEGVRQSYNNLLDYVISARDLLHPDHRRHLLPPARASDANGCTRVRISDPRRSTWPVRRASDVPCAAGRGACGIVTACQQVEWRARAQPGQRRWRA